MLPVPLAGHDEPALAVQVQVTLLKPEGKVSVTVAPLTATGPSLVAVIV